MGWTTLHGPLVSSGSQRLGCSGERWGGGARRRKRHTGERVAAIGRGVDSIRGGGGQAQRRGGGGWSWTNGGGRGGGGRCGRAAVVAEVGRSRTRRRRVTD